MTFGEPRVGGEVVSGVMAGASWRCECRGSCGRAHNGGRCDIEHQAGQRLHVVLSGDVVRALCDGCHAGVDRQQRRSREEQTRARWEAEQGSLFEVTRTYRGVVAVNIRSEMRRMPYPVAVLLVVLAVLVLVVRLVALVTAVLSDGMERAESALSAVWHTTPMGSRIILLPSDPRPAPRAGGVR